MCGTPAGGHKSLVRFYDVQSYTIHWTKNSRNATKRFPLSRFIYIVLKKQSLLFEREKDNLNGLMASQRAFHLRTKYWDSFWYGSNSKTQINHNGLNGGLFVSTHSHTRAHQFDSAQMTKQ